MLFYPGTIPGFKPRSRNTLPGRASPVLTSKGSYHCRAESETASPPSYFLTGVKVIVIVAVAESRRYEHAVSSPDPSGVGGFELPLSAQISPWLEVPEASPSAKGALQASSSVGAGIPPRAAASARPICPPPPRHITSTAIKSAKSEAKHRKRSCILNDPSNHQYQGASTHKPPTLSQQ